MKPFGGVEDAICNAYRSWAGANKVSFYTFRDRSIEGRKRVIVFKVSAVSSAIGGVRYRALLPALFLRRSGREVKVVSSFSDQLIQECEVAVFVKSFSGKDLKTFMKLRKRGAQIYLDLCDNLFVDGYSKNGIAERFVALAAMADGVITTSDALAEEIRRWCPTSRVILVPDPLETIDGLRMVEDTFAIDEPPYQTGARWSSAPLTKLGESRKILLWAGRNPARFGRKLFRVGREVVRHKLLAARRSVFSPQDIGFVRDLGGAVRSSLSVANRGLEAGAEAEHAPSKALGKRKTKEKKSDMNGRGPKAGKKKPRSGKKKPRSGEKKREPQDFKTVLWFGNHGGQHSNYGMLTLLSIMPEILRVSKRINIRLLIVSNSKKKFNKFFAMAPFKVEYLEWDAHEVYKVFSTADVCLLPNTMDDFSKVKSANRAVSALYHGVPVVATRTLALQPFNDCIAFDDFEQGMLRYLTNSEHSRRDLATAREVIEKTYSAAAITEIWESQILTADNAARRAGKGQAKRLMILISLVQDKDLLLPVIVRAQRDPRFDVKVVVLASLAYSYPRTIAALRDVGADLWFVDKADIEGGGVLESVKPNIILTASETSASPHWAVHSLVQIANAKAIQTYTVQHGLENIGLTYFDDVHGDDIKFSSQKVLTWCHPDNLPAQTPPTTRAKAVFVGCPKDTLDSTSMEGFPLAGETFVAIFENLHWHRYDDAYRAAFLRMIDDLASEFPDILFAIKPHPAGRWLTERYSGEQPKAANLIVADPLNVLWQEFPAEVFLRNASAVITTPSTIALDAARVGCPVAVFTGQYSIDIYKGLPQIESSPDAVAFVLNALSDGALDPETQRFVDQWVSETDAVEAILDEMNPYHD